MKPNKDSVKSLQFWWPTQFLHNLWVPLIHKINQEHFFLTENPGIDIHIVTKFRRIENSLQMVLTNSNDSTVDLKQF